MLANLYLFNLVKVTQNVSYRCILKSPSWSQTLADFEPTG